MVHAADCPATTGVGRRVVRLTDTTRASGGAWRPWADEVVVLIVLERSPPPYTLS